MVPAQRSFDESCLACLGMHQECRLAVPMTSGRWARIVVPISKQTSSAERLAGMHWFMWPESHMKYLSDHGSPSKYTVPAREVQQ